MPLTASQLYARHCGVTCEGKRRCHWCGSPCKELFPHDDLPLHPGFARNPHKAKVLSEPFICSGCWLWRRPRITTTNLRGQYKDIQNPQKLSWLFTPHEALTVGTEDFPLLLKFLLRPATPFALLLLDGNGGPNHLHLASVNEHLTVEAATPLAFTLNNNPLTYTVYELEEVLKAGDDAGIEPGTRELFRILRDAAGGLTLPESVVPPASKPEDENVKRGRGRPRGPAEPADNRVLQRVVPTA